MNKSVHKTSVKGPLFKARTLVLALILFFAAQGVWGETYYWVGGTADHETEWDELNNWNTVANGSGDAPSDNLTTSDSVIIPSGATIFPVLSDYSTNPVSSIVIQTGASLSITCSVDFSSTGFTNNGNVYFYNTTGGSAITFSTPTTDGNLGKFNFWGETQITINGDCTADTFNMVVDNNSHLVTDNFDAIIAKGTGNGKLSVTNGMEFSRASNTAGKTGSIIFSTDVDTKAIVTHAGVVLTLHNTYTINTETYAHNDTNSNVIAKTIIFGVFNATTSFDMAASAATGAGSTEVSVGSTGQLNSPLIKATNSSYNNPYSTEPFSNEGTITTKEFNIPYEIINKGTITADADGSSASITAGSFTDNGAGTGTINLKNGTTSLTVTNASTQNAIVLEETDSTIEGNYTLTSFTADDTTTMQGKTVTLNNSEITATTLSLKGASGDGNSLSLAGTGTTHKFISTGLSATYLSIDSNIQLANYSTLISNCEPTAGTTSADYGKVISNGWLIKQKNELVYTWTGAAAGDAGTAWDNGANWDTTIVPGTDCKIIIPAVTNLPVLPDAACAGGTLSIESGASVQLGAADLVLSGTYGGAAGTKLSNAGTIIYTGAGRISDGSNVINDTAQGTVDYAAGSGGTVTNFGDADDYYDLKISGTNWKLDGNTFKIAHRFNLASGASCQITDTPTIQSAGFTIDGNFSVNEDKNLILTPYNDTDAFTVPDGIQNKITFNGGNGHRGWLWLGSSTYNGTITFANAATFTYKLYLNGDAVLGADVTLTNSLTAIKSLTGSKSLTFSGTGTQTFTPGTTTSAKIIVNKNSTTQGELILVGNCTLADFEVQKCSLITVNDTPTFTTYTDSAAYGNLVFVNGANFTNAFTRNSGGTTTITGTIAADSVTLKDTTVNGTVNITATGASGTITLNGNVTDAATSTLNLNSPVIIGTGNHSISAGTIVFAAGATIDGDGTANLTLNPTTLVTINENVGDTTPLTSFAITGPSSIKCASIKTTGNQSYSGAVNLAGTGDLSLYATGTTPEVTFTANITGAGKTLKLPSAGATAVFGDGVTVNPAIDSDGTVKCTGSVTFKDANNFTNFTATGLGGKTLTFEAGKTQTVSGDLSLSGTSTTSWLALAPAGSGTWTLNCSDPDPSVSYVDVSYSTSINEITATGSNDNGHNVKWNFPGMTYTWKTAAADSDWTNPSNWEEESVPGKGSNVIIPAATPYPVLEADLDLLYNTQGKITVNGTFDLKASSLKVAEIQNNGTLRANGVTDQSITGTMKNGANSTVEYYGTGNNNLFWDGNDDGKQYVNLILDQEITYNGAIAAGGDITINKTSTLNGNVSAAGNITVNNTAASVTFGGNVTITGDTGVLTVNAPLTYNGTAVTTKAAQTYNSSVTISQDATFKANNGSTILFGGTVAGTAGTEKLTLSTAAVQFNGNVSNLAELTTETATINCTSVSTSGNQTYGGAVTIKATTTSLTSDSGDISFANTISGDAGTEALTLGAGTLSFANSVANLVELTMNADISIGTSGIQLAATNQIAFKGDVSAADKTLTINTPALNSTKASVSTITANQITLSQDTTVTSSNGIILNVPTVSGSDITITNSNALTLASGIDVVPPIINNGTITCNGDATFKKNYSGTGSLTLSSGTTEFNGDLDLSGVPAVNGFTHSSGTVLINPTGTSATVKGPATFNNFETTRSLILTGANIFNNFTANVSGGTITFPAGDTNVQTVNGTLTLSGTSGHLLTLTSSGSWKIDCSSSAAISYVDVVNSTSVNEVTATGSNDSGHNENWNFPGMDYTWQGGASGHETDWKIAANWSPESVPGKGSNVIIPAATNYPVLQENLDILYNTQGTITVNGTFDLAGNSLKVAEIQNNGTLKANGVTDQSITGTMKNGANSTVEYYGTGNNNLFWDGNDDGKQYVNLILDQEITYNGAIAAGGDITINKTSTLNGNVSAAGNITVNNTAASVTFGGNVTITGDTGVLTVNAPLTYNGTAVTTKAAQTYNSSVTISQDATFKANNGSTILFGGTVAGTAGTEKLTLSTAAVQFNGNVSNLAELTTAATTINCASVSTSGNQTYGGPVVINADTVLSSAAGNTIHFKSTVTGDDTHSLKVTAADSEFDGAITKLTSLETDATATFNTNANISSEGTLQTEAADIYCTQITTTGTQTYNGTVTLYQSPQLEATQIAFGSNITDSATSKTLKINSPKLISSIAVSGEAEISLGTLELLQDVEISSSNAAGLKLTVGSITGSDKSLTFAGNTSMFTLKDGIIVEPTFENNKSITCAGEATFKNNYSGSGSLTLSSGTTEFNGDLNLSSASGFTASGGIVVINPTSGSATVTGPATFYNFVLKNYAVINGNNSYNNFTASGLSDKTITFEAGKKQTINGILTLTGTDEHLLTLTSSGTWEIYCTYAIDATHNHDIKYIKVYNSENNDSSYFLTALHSKDYGGNVRWNFPNQVYEWKGSESGNKTDWNTATNWDPPSVPGKGSNIKILKGKPSYPIIINQNLDIWQSDTYPGSIEIGAGTDTITEANFDLRDNNLKAGTITNNGTLKLIGKTDQTIEAKMINGPGSTVEYTGTGDPTTVLPWDGDNGAGTDSKQYENLVFDRAINVSGDINVTASGTITIKNASIKSSGDQTYGGPVVINADTVLSSTGTDKMVYFKSTVTGDGTHSLTVSSADSRFDGTVTNLKALTTDAAQIYCTQITTTGTQTYKGTVTLYQSPQLEATQMAFGSNITESGGSRTLKINAPKLISSIAASNEAEISLGTLELIQSVEISSSNAAALKLTVGSITGSSQTLTFAGNTTLFTLKDGIEVHPAVINNKSITCAGDSTFKGTFTNTSGTITGDTTNGKTLTFEKAYSGTGSSMTASSGATTFKADVNLSGTTFTHSGGTVQFNGNGTAQSLTTKADGSTHFYNITVATPAKVSTTSSFFVDGTTWSNTTTSDGFTAATSSQITFTNASITIGGKNIFNKIVFPTASQTVSVTGSNNITDLTSSGASQNITFDSSNIFGTVLVSGAGTNLTAQNTQNEFNDTITIGSTSVAAGNISLKAKTTLSFAANFNCNSVTLDAAANAVTFNGNAQYNSSFVNNGTAATNFLASFKGNGNATFVSDAIFQGTTDTSYELSCPAANLIKCTNFVLYSGNYTFGGKLETTGDVIILGSGYNIDNDPDSPTGISGVFAYNQTRLSAPQFTGTFPAAASLSGTLTANADATIKVGKNFYANGTSLQGNNAWYIQLPKICDAAQGFAEAINTTAKNCKVSCWQSTNTAVDDTADAKIVAYNCTDSTGNANWNFADFEITAAYTVRDNAVYVEFNAPVRNLYNEVNDSIAYLTYKGTTNAQTSFSGIYSQPDCQDDDKIENVDVNLTDGKYILYLLAPDTWNTDATGKTPGTTDSTDRHGNKKTSVPYLDIPRSLTATAAGTVNNVNYIITNKWGKRLTNYSTRTTTTSHAYGETGDTHDVLDKTGPVLYSVRTGQELHTASNDEANVKSIDSHNFIEFRYSEPVKFDDSASLTYTALNTIPADPADADQNIQVTDDFGALIGDITTEGPLKFKGLGQIDGGLIHTGNKGSTDKYVNSLYRRDAYSISISIAGYTNGTVTDNSGYTYKKWPGYIEQAELPNGQVTFLVDADNKNLLVKDLDGNAQEKYAHDDSNTIPTVDSTTQGLYGKWDISEPIFAIIRQNSQNTPWTQAKFNTNYQSEAIGSTPGGVGSSLDRIEFHVYDNTPDFNDTDAPTWFTEVGWCGDPDTSEDKTDSFLLSHNTYAADIFGGSRPFATDAYRTSGGLRYSTVQNSAAAFKYGVGSSAATTSFDTSIYVYGGASSLIFTGTSLPRRAAQDPEGLYFALPLTGNSYDLKTSFTVHYDDTVGFITDLAGNRLRAKTVSTIDRTPPGIDMTISPIGRDEVEVVFVKELCIDSDKLEFLDNTTGDKVDITENFNSLITQCFDIITIDNTGAPHNDAASVDLSINTSVPAKVWVEKNSNDSAFTHIRMKLNRAVKLEDLTKYYLRVVYVEKYGELSTDLFTRHQNSRITFIQDENGNTIQMYTAHALSDFAVGEVNPLYAYDSSMTEGDGTIISGGLWHKDNSDDVDTESWAVHDWNRTQTNYGTLPAGHTVAIVADTVSAANVKIYLANHPDEKSVSTQANKDFEFTTPWRIWLPDIMAPVFTSLAEKNNTKYSQNTGTLLNGKSKRFIFDLDSAITDLWKAGDQVSFIFGITNADGSPVTITHAPELDINIDKNYLTTSTKMPLFALRQTEEDNFMSLDLWSFRLKSIVAQRGGVTILNNVINSAVGEKVVLRVDLPEESNLKVLVMTLDGNIVDYLARGVTSSGEHYYSWDGSNRNGKPVARGMYFIRVMAEGIDETRKVLVVKE